MLLDVDVKIIIDKIGHDGSAIIWPHLPDPLCRRGFHIQELIDVADDMGCALTEIQQHPVSAPIEGEHPYCVNFSEIRFARHLKSPGLIYYSAGSNMHMAAWDGEKVYCPSLGIQNVKISNIAVFWKITLTSHFRFLQPVSTK